MHATICETTALCLAAAVRRTRHNNAWSPRKSPQVQRGFGFIVSPICFEAFNQRRSWFAQRFNFTRTPQTC
jgi:hypothetical protein